MVQQDKNTTETANVIGYSDYKITSNGDVYSYKRGVERKLKPFISGKGYLQVCLSEKSRTKGFLIHRLVAIHFIKNPLNKVTVNHVDGDKLNNNVSNLEWATNEENIRHSIESGACNRPKWSSHSMSKPVVQHDESGHISTFGSAGEAEFKTGVKRKDISLCCNGKRNSAGGFYWTFKEVK